MEQEQQEAWHSFERNVVSRTREEYHPGEAGVMCLLRIIVDPSFDPLVSWRVCRQSSRSEGDVYFALFSRWRRDEDVKKFLTPIERLKHPRTLTPTVENGRVELDGKFVEDVMRRFETASIPAFIAEHIIGADGESYELTIGSHFLEAKYSWWVSPPAGWVSLGRIVRDVLRHLNEAVESSL